MALKHKRLLITGANGGLGLATSIAAAREGATVLLGCRTAAKAESTRTRVELAVPGATALAAGGFDMLDPEAIAAAVDRLPTEPVDVVFLQAGGWVFADQARTVELNSVRFEETVAKKAPMTRILGRILLGLPGLFIALTGTVFLLVPSSAADKLLWVADNAEALSNIRGMAGAPLLAVGATLINSAITARLEYARPAAIFLLALIGARLLSYGIDGAPGSILLFLAVPSVAFGSMLAGHILIERSAKKNTTDAAAESEVQGGELARG